MWSHLHATMATARFSTYPQRIHAFVHRLVQTTIQSCMEEHLDLTGPFTDASWIMDSLWTTRWMQPNLRLTVRWTSEPSVHTSETTMCSSTQLLACHHMVLPINHHPYRTHSVDSIAHCSHKHQTPARCHPTCHCALLVCICILVRWWVRLRFGLCVVFGVAQAPCWGGGKP
jgi:hypothetical protein